jgi:hypothetical protein
MAYATRELLNTQERDPYPRIKPAPDGVRVVTLAAVGAAPTYAVGTPMAYNTATNKWVVWTSGGANGTGTISGFIYPDEIETDAADDVMCPLMQQGTIDYADVVLPAGETDANLKTALRSGPRALGLIITGLSQVR